ncbi:MAG: hypothetical protein J6B01_06715 [Ruminococcus sp.]|nr:hypothetical protein [Ruminococcus sp.]
MNMEEIALKLQEVIDRAARNEGRIKKLEGEHEVLQKLATSVAVMAEQIKTMNSNVQVLTGKVDKLEEKPSKRWDGLIDKIILTVAAAVVGFLLAHFGF